MTTIQRLIIFVVASVFTGAGPASASSVTPDAAEKLDLAVEQFSRIPATDRLKVSADGKRIAGIVPIAGRDRLVMFSLGDGVEAKVFPLPEADVRDLEWIDSANLALLMEDGFAGWNLIRYDLNTNEATVIDSAQLAPGLITAAEILPPYTFDDGEIDYKITFYTGVTAILSWQLESDSVYIKAFLPHPNDRALSQASGNAWLVEEWNGFDYSLHFRENFGFTPDDVAASMEAGWLQRLLDEIETEADDGEKGGDAGDSSELFSGSYIGHEQVRPVMLAADRPVAYLSVSKGDKHSLRSFDLENREFIDTLAKDDQYEIDATPVLAEFSGEILGFSYYREHIVTRYIETDFAQQMRRVEQAFPDHRVLPISLSEDKRVVVVKAFSSKDPGEYFVFDTAAGTVQPLLSSAEWLQGAPLARKEVIRYEARDGYEIEAYLTRPASGARPAPLVVLPHGGPHARDTRYFDPQVQFLARLGYAVIQPNYRVSSGYGAGHTAAGLGRVGGVVQHDIIDSISWARSQGYGLDGRVCILGGSFGAYSAVRSATLEPEAFRCVVAIAGLYDLVEQMEFDQDHPGYDVLKLIYGDPDDVLERERLVEMSPIHEIEKLVAPILVIHGERDRRVPVDQANLLIERLEELDKPHEVLIRRDEGHGFSKNSNRERMNQRIGEFLLKHLPPENPEGHSESGE
ncbi:MAG: prolyl oligopeptidase family serine peptidase [Gammaproteobacteria bacterium]|nr:prolyl oligopeptidase family serine peptidase [Gammaproteobacteria bacterium]